VRPVAKWLVAVCAGQWQLHGISSAMRAGLNVLALDGDASTPGLRAATQGVVTDIRDTDAVIEAVLRASLKPDGAVAFAAEAGMAAVGALRSRFALPGPPRSVIAAISDKIQHRRAWDGAGLPNPRWRPFHSGEEAFAAVEDIGLPVIVKPSDSAGSRGVTLVSQRSDIAGATERALSTSRSKSGLVESILAGTEHTVETFSIDGICHVLAVTRKRKVPGTRGTVASELVTVAYQHPLMTKIREVTSAALAALGYREGPAHTEIMITDEHDIGLIETAGRGGGFGVFDLLVPMASGYDIATATALLSVGMPPPSIVNWGHAVCLRFTPSRPGRIVGMSGFDEANRLPGVVAGPLVGVGHVAHLATTDGDRLAYFVARAKTPEAAVALADEAQGLISFKIEPC
jgi:biotin carboxylase